MGKPRGITVSLLTRTQSGTDAFNRPVCQESSVAVDNVLVGSPTDQELVSDLQMYGKKCVYVLAIPKGDAHQWEDSFVEFDPTGGSNPQRFRTFGIATAGIEDLIPLAWNKQIHVEAYADEQYDAD